MTGVMTVPDRLRIGPATKELTTIGPSGLVVFRGVSGPTAVCLGKSLLISVKSRALADGWELNYLRRCAPRRRHSVLFSCLCRRRLDAS
jgi:hypothetical protein